jgi:hypothetical protein
MQQNADPGAQVAAQFGFHRSPKWPKAEKDHLRYSYLTELILVKSERKEHA